MGRTRVRISAILVLLSTAITVPPVDANTRSQQHYAKGLAPYQAGKWESAYTSFTNAIKADPNDALALYYRGITGARLGFVQESIADLERALQVRPGLENAVLDLGALYLEAGEYERAESWLKRAYEMPASRFPAALFLGIANYRRGDDAGAQSYLQTAAKDPRLRPTANYYEALALLRQGHGSAASRLLSKSKRALPNTAIANAVKEFDAGAQSYDRDDGEPLTIYGEIGFAYDTNVALAPDNKARRAVLRNAGTLGKIGEGRFQIGAGARYRFLDTDHLVASVGYELYQGKHFSTDRYDISSHRVRADLNTRADRWYQLGLSTFYNYYARDYSSFFQDFTVSPWAVFYEGDVAATQVYYRFRGRDFSNHPFKHLRDSINNAIGVRQMLLLGAVDRTLTFGYQWSDNDPLSADGTDFAYMRHRFDIEFEAAVMDWFNAKLGYAALIDDYEHENSRTNFSYGRNDAEHQIVIRVERPITDQLTAGLDYFGILNHSNLEPFEYDRSIVAAGVRMHF